MLKTVTGNIIEKQVFIGIKEWDILSSHCSTCSRTNCQSTSACRQVTRQTEHDAAGELARRWYFTYDAAGHVIEERNANANSALAWKWRYAYDSLGRRIEKTQYTIRDTRVQTWFYAYDSAGISSKKPPIVATTPFGGNAATFTIPKATLSRNPTTKLTVLCKAIGVRVIKIEQP